MSLPVRVQEARDFLFVEERPGDRADQRESTILADFSDESDEEDDNVPHYEPLTHNNPSSVVYTRLDPPFVFPPIQDGSTPNRDVAGQVLEPHIRKSKHATFSSSLQKLPSPEWHRSFPPRTSTR